MLKRGDNLGWVCQRPSHTLFMVCCVLPLSHQHQPTMIKTIDSREAMRGKNLTHHRRNNQIGTQVVSKKLDTEICILGLCLPPKYRSSKAKGTEKTFKNVIQSWVASESMNTQFKRITKGLTVLCCSLINSNLIYELAS